MWKVIFSLDLEEASECLAGLSCTQKPALCSPQPPRAVLILLLLFKRLPSNLCFTLTFCRTAFTPPTSKGYYEMIFVKDPSQRLTELNFNFNSTMCDKHHHALLL